MFSAETAAASVDQFGASMRAFHPVGFRAMARACAEDLRGALPLVTVPTLLVYGANDVRAPMTVAEPLHASISGSTLVVLPGVSHVCNIALVRHFGYVGKASQQLSHELYHDDAVLEFPQSGERFEGVDNFREWREQYPAQVAFRLRRITGSGDVWVGEISISYDGGPWMLAVGVHEFRGDRIARERIYVTEPWDAPEWRAPWRAAAPAD